MTRLTNADDEDLVSYVLEFLLKQNQSKIISTTLDGMHHVQTIGQSNFVASIKVHATETQKAIIDNIAANAEIIYLLRGSNIYTGMIKDAVDWEMIFNGKMYEGNFEYLVMEITG